MYNYLENPYHQFTQICTTVKNSIYTNMKLSLMSLMLYLFSALVEVRSQTAPYITVMGTTLPNNSYVALSRLGIAEQRSAQCHTDLSTCCGTGQNDDRGDWFLPTGTRLPPRGFGNADGFYNVHAPQRVDLHHSVTATSMPIEGMFKCTIETVAVRSNNSSDFTTRETLFLGIYESGGEYI